MSKTEGCQFIHLCDEQFIHLCVIRAMLLAKKALLVELPSAY